MKNVSMTDHKPYEEIKAKYDEINNMLRPLITGDTPDVLRMKARAAEVSIEMEAAALLDPKLKKEADKARQAAEELRERAANKEREIMVLQTALQKLAPDLEKAKEEASLKVIRVVRPEHENLVPKILDAMRQLNALFEEEAGLYNHLKKEIDSGHCITPIFLMLADNWGRIQPGREDVWDSQSSRVLRMLRKDGYNV